MSKAEELAQKLPDAIGSVDMLTCVEAGRHLRALDASHQRLQGALKEVGLLLHHFWCDVQMNDYSFDKLNTSMASIDAAIKQAKELS